MKKPILLFLLSLLAACASASPEPADVPRAITPLTLEPPPVYALLGYRQELKLESAQIAALDSIAQRVRDLNAPLADSLRRVGRDRGGRGWYEVDAQTEPLLERIRANNREAVDEVREVLTETQRATACRLFDQSRERRSERQREGGRREMRGMMTDSLAGVGGRVWTWCGGS